MKTLLKPLVGAACALVLIACGGPDPVQPAAVQPQIAATTAHRASSRVTVPSDYYDVIQRVYVAYFGRPADTGGLEFFAGNYMSAGAATNIVEVSAAYGINPAITALIDSFGTSAESMALYPGTNVQFVTAIYSNLFNRVPDQGGLDFWVGNIDAGRMTRAQAAVAIMAGSQGTDAELITKKTVAARAFTSTIDTDAERLAYTGLDANVVVRNMLNSITLATDPATFQATIDATFTALMPKDPAQLFTQVQTIVKNRCVGCHSAKPTIAGFNPAPLGIRYDTAASIEADKERIADVVKSGSMPYGNITGMTDAERTTVAEWFASRAQ
ncbi:MAG: DUF4214 domain-containing protein [Pseudomonadota bacterium]